MIALSGGIYGGDWYREDTSVEKIRDGTANVLALDVIRPCTGGHATNAFSTVRWSDRHVSRHVSSSY